MSPPSKLYTSNVSFILLLVSISATATASLLLLLTAPSSEPSAQPTPGPALALTPALLGTRHLILQGGEGQLLPREVEEEGLARDRGEGRRELCQLRLACGRRKRIEIRVASRFLI